MNFRKLIAPALLAAAVAMAGIARAQEGLPENVTNRFRERYNAEAYDSIYPMLSDTIHKLVAAPQMKAQLAAIHQLCGAITSCSVSETASLCAMAKSANQLQLAISSDGRIAGLHIVPGRSDSKPLDPAYAPDNASIETPAGSLHGSLMNPRDTARTVVLIVAGSGPTDRNGNSTAGLRTDCYYKLARALDSAGIATLRYDKRFVSTPFSGDPAGVRFDDYVSDAAAWIHFLRAEKKFARVVVLGHSEGSLVSIEALQRENASGFISLAGAGERADSVLLRQIRARMGDKTAGEAAPVLTRLAGGERVTDVPASLAVLFNPAVQGYLISWLPIDPAVEIHRLKLPVLIVQGDRDLQVGVADAGKLKAALPAAKLAIVPGMNHVLVASGKAEADNLASYNDPARPLAPGLAGTIVAFVRSLK